MNKNNEVFIRKLQAGFKEERHAFNQSMLEKARAAFCPLLKKYGLDDSDLDSIIQKLSVEDPELGVFDVEYVNKDELIDRMQNCISFHRYQTDYGYIIASVVYWVQYFPEDELDDYTQGVILIYDESLDESLIEK